MYKISFCLQCRLYQAWTITDKLMPSSSHIHETAPSNSSMERKCWPRSVRSIFSISLGCVFDLGEGCFEAHITNNHTNISCWLCFLDLICMPVVVRCQLFCKSLLFVVSFAWWLKINNESFPNCSVSLW